MGGQRSVERGVWTKIVIYARCEQKDGRTTTEMGQLDKWESRTRKPQDDDL